MATLAAAGAFAGGRPLREALLGDLAWRRPGVFSRALILEAGSERLAGLRWEKWYSFEAVAESADGRWVIGRRRGAPLSREVVVRDGASGEEIASFTRNWRGAGTLTFASGVRYRWRPEGFWRTRYHWMAEDDRPLITFRSVIRFHRSYEMEVDPSARSLAELHLLVLLGGYVMAMISASHSAS